MRQVVVCVRYCVMDRFYRFSSVPDARRPADGCRGSLAHTAARISDPRAPAENCNLGAMDAGWGFVCDPKGVKKENGQKWDKKSALPCFLAPLGVTFISPGATSRQPRGSLPRSHQSGCLWIRAGFILASPSGQRWRFVRGSSELGPGPVASAPSCIAKWFWTRNEMGLDVRSRGRAGACCSKSVRFLIYFVLRPS